MASTDLGEHRAVWRMMRVMGVTSVEIGAQWCRGARDNATSADTSEGDSVAELESSDDSELEFGGAIPMTMALPPPPPTQPPPPQQQQPAGSPPQQQLLPTCERMDDERAQKSAPLPLMVESSAEPRPLIDDRSDDSSQVTGRLSANAARDTDVIQSIAIVANVEQRTRKGTKRAESRGGEAGTRLMQVVKSSTVASRGNNIQRHPFFAAIHDAWQACEAVQRRLAIGHITRVDDLEGIQIQEEDKWQQELGHQELQQSELQQRELEQQEQQRRFIFTAGRIDMYRYGLPIPIYTRLPGGKIVNAHMGAAKYRLIRQGDSHTPLAAPPPPTRGGGDDGDNPTSDLLGGLLVYPMNTRSRTSEPAPACLPLRNTRAWLPNPWNLTQRATAALHRLVAAWYEPRGRAPTQDRNPEEPEGSEFQPDLPLSGSVQPRLHPHNNPHGSGHGGSCH